MTYNIINIFYYIIINMQDNRLNEDDLNLYREVCSNEYDYLPTIILKKVKRIIAIGDIHGDIELALNFLKVGKLITEINHDEYSSHKNNKNIDLTFRVPFFIDNKYFNQIYDDIEKIFCDNDSYDINMCENKFNNDDKIKFRYFKWIGKDTYVVQVGDQVDRCRPTMDKDCANIEATFEDENSDIIIMNMFDVLNRIAKKVNGAVYSLIGNHEVMNFDNNFDYVSNRGMLDYASNNIINDGKHNRYEKFTNMRHKFACTRNTIIIINGFIFVHGGLAGALLSKYKVENINHIIRSYIYDSFEKIKKTHIDISNYKNIINSSKISPLWYRKLAYIKPDLDNNDNNNNNEECDLYLKPVINLLAENNIYMRGLIIGHTPQFSIHNLGINTACNKHIIRVDIGASKAFNNIIDSNMDELRKPQVAEILRKKKNFFLINVLN